MWLVIPLSDAKRGQKRQNVFMKKRSFLCVGAVTYKLTSLFSRYGLNVSWCVESDGCSPIILRYTIAHVHHHRQADYFG